MARAARTCTQCPAIITSGSRCERCTTAARTTPEARARDLDRGTAAQRGYTGAGHKRFRKAVLARDPICVLCRTAWSTVADHHPKSRRELVAAGQDPNDPANGRGLCKRCHDRETARHQPGGWNARPGVGGAP